MAEGGLIVRWAGVAEVTRALDDMILAIRMDLKAAMSWYGHAATTEMKANHEKDAHDIQRYVNRTWYLTNSIMYDTEDRGQTIRVRFYTPAWYAELVESGTPRSQAYPFFWPPIRNLEPIAQNRVVQVLLEALAKHETWVKAGGGRVRGTIMETDFTVNEIMGGLMDDIKLKLLDLMRTDPTLQALLGGSPSDPRVYMYYQGDALIDPQHPAYITFSNISTPEATQAVENPVFSIVVWSRTWARCEEVRDRLRDLFHKKIFVTAPDSRRIYTKLVGEQDSYQDQPKFAGKTMQLRAGWSTV